LRLGAFAREIFFGRIEMRFVFTALILILLVGSVLSQPVNFTGRWQVKFTVLNTSEKNLILTAQENGDGTFELLDTGIDDKPVPGLKPAAWSLTNNNLSVSGEVELPTGTCCRETGTLILKSKLTASNSISGKLIFVTNIDEDESPYKYHATVGTFTASRLK
jgi:hypothetical protein